jgi:hypothetical protein
LFERVEDLEIVIGTWTREDEVVLYYESFQACLGYDEYLVAVVKPSIRETFPGASSPADDLATLRSVGRTPPAVGYAARCAVGLRSAS